MIRPAPYHLIVLGLLGVSSIWGFIGYWGHMFDNFGSIVATGHLPDGRVMRLSYTGVDVLDRQITPVIAFYEVLSNGLSLGPRLLFLDINFVIACTNVWVMIEARRRGVQSVMLKYPFVCMLLWNFIGAALIQPHYLYLIEQSYRRLPSQDPTIPRHEAIALFLTTIMAVSCPALLFAPAWLQANTWTHHGLIGLFHTTPILLAIAFFITSRILSSPSLRYLTQSPADADFNPRIHPDQPWVTRSYILAGTASATVHLFTMITALRTQNPDITLLRLFIPTKQRLAIANTLPLSWTEPKLNTTSTSLLTETNGKAARVLEQFHLFSQFDWIVVSLACIVFTHLLLSQAREKKSLREEGMSHTGLMDDVDGRDLGLLLLGTVILGPGAAGSFALAQWQLL
ncbi:hypothetical protein N7468_006154 [Penicillium chermesinum]|uniref:Uncharacterized protein n=1 Tax=Penicillium chermesinum TaxID=63820 RepID=A0A9W9TP72_9EURO|nr:uncharacterized protein N7468_006154 [Penicillium chermesinum]KAJ5233198.1 hypothetical protein N7468_006154 [Penicillium chermesinum]KAJ6172834.1 hypothetical protein N7470_001901 [Penicillium chermesinum]